MRKILSPLSAGSDRPNQGRGILLTLRRFVEDRRGVGAVEFAIVAPLLLMAYVGAFEVTVAVSASRKVSRAASTVSDLLTQDNLTDVAKLAAMTDVVRKVVAPYEVADGYSMKITGIAVASDGTATVAWSRDQAAGTPYAKGSPETLPKEMQGITDTFLVRTELKVPYNILLLAPNLDSDLNRITLSRTTYFRQRVGKKIDCTGC